MASSQPLSLSIKALYPGQDISDLEAVDAGQRLTDFVKILLEINTEQQKAQKQ